MPALNLSSIGLAAEDRRGHSSLGERSADKPLDGFDRLKVCDTAGTLGALTHSTPLRVILSLSNG